jgi:hypothetical protein
LKYDGSDEEEEINIEIEVEKEKSNPPVMKESNEDEFDEFQDAKDHIDKDAIKTETILE